jgi:hypothetical protein
MGRRPGVPRPHPLPARLGCGPGHPSGGAMDPTTFDTLVRSYARRGSRRWLVRLVAALPLGGALAVTRGDVRGTRRAVPRRRGGLLPRHGVCGQRSALRDRRWALPGAWRLLWRPRLHGRKYLRWLVRAGRRGVPDQPRLLPRQWVQARGWRRTRLLPAGRRQPRRGVYAPMLQQQRMPGQRRRWWIVTGYRLSAAGVKTARRQDGKTARRQVKSRESKVSTLDSRLSTLDSRLSTLDSNSR